MDFNGLCFAGLLESIFEKIIVKWFLHPKYMNRTYERPRVCRVDESAYWVSMSYKRSLPTRVDQQTPRLTNDKGTSRALAMANPPFMGDLPSYKPPFIVEFPLQRLLFQMIFESIPPFNAGG